MKKIVLIAIAVLMTGTSMAHAQRGRRSSCGPNGCGMTELRQSASVATATDIAAYEWRTPANDPGRLHLYLNGEQIGGYDLKGKYYRAVTATGWAAEGPIPSQAPPPGANPGDDALALVNAQRAASGLRPYLPDRGLNKAARDCAAYRAANGISGHTSNDFGFVPPGTHASTAGCAAWADGFGACAIFDNFGYCGAAWVRGRDGLKYCHCFYR